MLCALPPLLAVLFVVKWLPAGAYPGLLPVCSDWKAGGAGYMGVETLEDGSGDACRIDLSGIPENGYTAGSTYTVKVSSDHPSLFKLHSSDGQCLGHHMSNKHISRSESFEWVAPADGNTRISFYALCGVGYHKLRAAPPQSVAAAADGAAVERRLHTAPKKTIADVDGLSLGDTGVKVSFKPLGSDSADFTVTINKETWLSIGIAGGKAAKMPESDAVVCSAGQVLRYQITTYSLSNGVAVPGASCTQENGKTTLSFSRTLAAQGAQKPIKLEGKTTVIWAHGDDGVTTSANHQANRGGQTVNFSSGTTGDAEKISGPAVLYLHLILMSIAWGALLPTGSIFAKRFHWGAVWFIWHRRLQTLGWFLQILGFVFAMLYAQEYSTHFHNLHGILGVIVVALGTMQPLNALLRPPASKPDQEKPIERRIWEAVHKSFGWLAVGLGMVNVLAGCVLVLEKDFNAALVGCAFAIGIICLLVPLFIALASIFARDKIAYWLAVDDVKTKAKNNMNHMDTQ